MIIKGNINTRSVTIDGKYLDPRPSQTVWNHSPDGFNWGYHGSGPAQLALAILLKATGDKTKSAILHQEFKQEYIAPLPQNDDFTLDVDVVKWVEEKSIQKGL